MKGGSRPPGRLCPSGTEISDLKYGMDFRDPRYRREVFLRFYEFHLKYRAHPGAVYYVLPFLRERLGWDTEQSYWFAFLNGCTQNPVTSWLIWSEFPRLPKREELEGLGAWFRKEGTYERLEFDTDRRYVKTSFAKMVGSYLENLGGKTQEEFFLGPLGPDERENFRGTWDRVIGGFDLFGRLATFSYLEYLRILGTPIDCDQLFLEDMSGSKSHRNGLCRVLGRDDLDWHSSNPEFDGYSDEVISWLKDEGETLLKEAKTRFRGRDFERDVGYFTLESTLCNYKGWHRVNRRYPNVYNDMFHDRIRRAEGRWGERFGVFWEARKKYLPDRLRLEKCPLDKGVTPEKQNHYRLTGQPIMMDGEWDCFRNDYNDRISSSEGSGILSFF